MRILQVVTSTDRRGAETFARQLAPRLEGRGFDVRTVALAPGHQVPADDAAEVLGAAPRSPRTLWALRRAARSADVVVAHGSDTLAACAIALAGSGVPFVYRNIGDPLHWWARRGVRLRVRAYLGQAAHVMALWPGAARHLVDRLGVPSDRITVVPNGVDTTHFPAPSDDDRAKARAALGLDATQRVVAFVGALSVEKDVPTAIEAVDRLPGATLLVAGDGPVRDDVSALAMGRRVRLLGAVDDPRSVLLAADALVLPSLTEGLPGVLIEAGLCGLPAVATAVGGVDEIVDDGVTGRLVPPGDPGAMAAALGAILDDPSAARRMGEEARARCLARFDLDGVTEAFARVAADLAVRRTPHAEGAVHHAP